MRQAFQQFKQTLKTALIHDISELLTLCEGEIIYGLALVTDSFIESLSLVMNTEESLKTQIDKHQQHYNALDKREYAALRWTPSEWYYSSANVKNSAMLEINQFLQTKIVEDFALFELQFYETVIEVLNELKTNQMADQFALQTDIVFFLSIGGDERAQVIENYTAEQLNTTEIFQRFLQRYG